MGNELFGVDLAGIIDEVISPGVLPVRVSRTPDTGARAPGNLTGGLTPAAPHAFDCRGFFEDFTGLPPPGVELELNDRKAVLIGDSIPAGEEVRRGDAITIEGVTLYAVKLVSRDPAAAVFVYQCRDRGPAEA